MSKTYIDPAIQRKRDIVHNSLDFYEGVPLPSVVEINESGKCNRSCSFCPKSDPSYPDVLEFIDTSLIQKITLELGGLNYSGIFIFSGFCEPLLDKNIFELIRISKLNMPNAKIELVTNGDPLNPHRLRKLFDSGLTTLNISAYDDESQVLFLEDMAKKAGIHDSQFVVRPRWLSEDDSFGITINNRSGALENAEFIIEPLKEPLKQKCNYPSYNFFMDYNGDVLLCSHDWLKKYIAGNMIKDTFLDIWTGPKMMGARKSLLKENRNFSPCDVCDVDGMLLGNIQADTWIDIINNE
jgi:radical SAM protein with 4Fe4S-binding SPASM domain